jgi:hypothetical protein
MVLIRSTETGQYALSVALSPDRRQLAGNARAELEAMTPEASLRCAALLREVKPTLGTERQNEIAEELALHFEQRAGVDPSRPQSR